MWIRAKLFSNKFAYKDINTWGGIYQQPRTINQA